MGQFGTLPQFKIELDSWSYFPSVCPLVAGVTEVYREIKTGFCFKLTEYE